MLAFLGPLARTLSEPLVTELRAQVYRLLIAICLGATGVACVIVGLAYFASSLWHGLTPVIGVIGSDLLLGALYGLLAIVLLRAGSKMVR